MFRLSGIRRQAAILILTCWTLAAHAGSENTQGKVRGFLEGLDAGGPPLVGGQILETPGMLSRFYQARNHEPIWIAGAPLEGQASAMIEAISGSVEHGFNPDRYHQQALEKVARSEDAESRFTLEMLLTDAFLAQATHRAQGAVYPPNLDAEWLVPQAEIDAVALLDEVAGDKRSVRAALDSLWPKSDEYARLLERRAEILASGEEIMIRVPAGALIKPGQSEDRIVLLKERLMGVGDHTPLYDEELREEVIAFQRSAGLEPDGIVGENTLEMLNATRMSWIEKIDANLERWRWLPRETPDTYIRVNIAAFALRGIENGNLELTMDVIVGQPYRRTPVFTETIKYMVLNPFWNVPFSIATKDKLPLLKNDPAALALNGYEVRLAGSENFVPVDTVDWTEVTARSFDHLLRQRPGAANALGRIKFMLPNPFSVYLHDTPTRELFSRQERAFSSGCIRLEQPLKLAQWLLARENHANADQIEELLDSGETISIYLDQPMPTYIVYFTAFSLDDGKVTFRRDVYGRDRPIIEALRGQ